jgi:hypothetical protein
MTIGQFNLKGNTTMAIIKDVSIFFAKLNPEKPNARFDQENPTWELQIRTSDKKVAAEWKAMNLRVTTGEDQDGKLVYRANLKKKSKKRDGTDNLPVTLVNGSLEQINPDTLGNGSKGNVRVYQYPYNVAGKEGIATMLMAVQITELFEFTPKPREDDFAMVETKVVKVADNQEVGKDEFVSSDLEDEIIF